LSQLKLGLFYEHGYGVPNDNKEALKWYRKSAENGNDLARSILASMYERGDSGIQDYAEALKWYRKGAEQGISRDQ
jgi:TPR repeat protein